MNVILGAGLSGLTAGLILTRAGCRTTILEQNNRVGGLARTIRCGEFRFDLGGHRFLTDNRLLLALLADLLAGDLLTVPRKSRICISGRYINYPLTPLNAFFGLFHAMNTFEMEGLSYHTNGQDALFPTCFCNYRSCASTSAPSHSSSNKRHVCAIKIA